MGDIIKEFLNKGVKMFDKVIDQLGGLGGVLSGIGALAGAYGAYKSGKAQEKAADRAYNLNLSLLNEERARRAKADQNLANAYAGSNYAKEQVKAF